MSEKGKSVIRVSFDRPNGSDEKLGGEGNDSV